MDNMTLAFLILIATTVAFVIGKWRSDFVAIASLLVLSITGIITPAESVAGFSNSVVIMIAALFIVGQGIFNTGLANKMGEQLIKLGGHNDKKLIVIVMLTVGAFSAFMSNTGTVAILLPVVISMAIQAQTSPSKFLMPLAYASSLGGVITLIGTPPNLVINDFLKESGVGSLHFFGFTPIGIIALLVGIIYMLFIGRYLLPNALTNTSKEGHKQQPSELAGYYKIYDRLHMLQVNPESTIVEQSLAQLKLPEKYGITVVTIKRKTSERTPFRSKIPHLLSAQEPILAGDIMLLFGEDEAVNHFAKTVNAEVIKWEDGMEIDDLFFSRTLGLTEIIITPQSTFIGKTLKEIAFRTKYHCNVLAIHRKGAYIQDQIVSRKLRSGDALLIHGKWEDIERIDNDHSDVVIVGKVAEKASSAIAKGKASIAAAIMLFMLLMMTLEWIAPVTSALIAAFLMIVTGCVRLNDAYKSINWESVVLIAAMLPMATALEKTGGVELISNFILQQLGDFGPYAILGGFYLLTMTFGQFISNTATAVIFAPVALMTAQTAGISPFPLLISVAVAASMSFATPVATPPNAMVMSAGGYTFFDYVKVGIPLQIIIAIVMIIAIPLFYPF